MWMIAMLVGWVLTWTSPGPGRLEVRLRVPEHTVRVAVTVWNGDYMRESEYNLRDGSTQTIVQWRGIPSDEYHLDARALSDAGRITQSPVWSIRVR